MKAVPLLAILTAACLGAAGSADAQSETPPRPSSSSLGVFLGGVPSGQPTADVLPLTVADAIRRALDHNLGVLMAEQEIGRARGVRWKALSGLLPNINSRVAESRQQINLEAFGFGSFGDSFAGVPTIVGPFNVFDARVYVSQAVLDFGALNDARAEAHNVEAARDDYAAARDLVVHVAADAYIQALAASARADSGRAQQQTAQSLYDQSVDLKAGGLVAGLDVLRAEVQLTLETRRANAASTDFEKTKLQLAHLIGLPLGQRFSLDPNLPELPEPDITLDQAIDRAYTARSDYRAALERVRAAESARRSKVGEGLPSVKVNADYGGIGLTPGDARGTFSVTGAVTVPLFQGGRTRGQVLEADADLLKRRSEADDLKATIYYEVRTALLDLQAMRQQLQVATKARELAASELVQARDRFAAGVASNIEVVQAQETVAIANEQFISAQYGYALAKGALIRGIGTPEETLRQLFGGTR